jgi:hypothetical protein
MNSYGVDKGTTIRYPATAQLMIDSQDESTGATTNHAQLSYTSAQAFQNGFFSRLSIPEACLEWSIPNVVGPDVSGFQFAVDISGTTSGTILRIPNGYYNAAEMIDAIAASMNAAGVFGTVTVVQNYVNTVTPALSGLVIQATSGFRWSASQPTGNLAGRNIQSYLGVALGGTWLTTKKIGSNPQMVFVRYLDFISPQITYPQDLKDSNTTGQPYDVLLRWYFERTDDTQPTDKYGYPIPYAAIQVRDRRLWNPPKQIKWDNNLPLGNFDITVYYQIQGVGGPPGPLAPFIEQITTRTGLTQSAAFKYLMTLQLSEN